MMLDTFDHKIWLPRFYDLDTICSYDNTGQIKFDVDIEMEQGYWNTSASRLWTKIRDLMHDDLVEVYKDMRANGMSYESFMSYFYDQQIAQIPQSYYNKDADVKYLPFADAYIGKAHGDGYEHLKRWLKNRLIFTDTLFDYQPSYEGDILTIRANTTETMTLEIETYTPVYQHLSWYNGQMDKKKIDGKISVSFSGKAQASTDQEILIYGGTNVKSIKGVSTCNPSQLLIGSATRLTELDSSNSPILTDINSDKANLLPHVYLNTINLSNCNTLGGTLKINNSPLIKDIDISNTQITDLQLPPSLRNLEKLTLTNDIKTLSLKNVPLLTDMMIPSNIEYLCIENASRLTRLIGDNCPKLETFIAENVGFNPISQVVSKANNLKRIRLINLDIACSYTDIIKISKLIGVDKNGADAPISECVTGKITLGTCSESILKELEMSLPNVDFTVLSYAKSFIVTFVDGDGNILYECQTLENGEAIYVGETPNKTSTAQYDYTWKGWDRQLKPIVSNTTINATFDSILRYYTIRFISSVTLEVISSQYLAYGSTPTKPEITDGNNAWKPNMIESVTKDFDYYTHYIPYPDDLSIFNFIEVNIDGIAGYSCIHNDSSKNTEMSYLIIPFEYNDKPVLLYGMEQSPTVYPTNLTDIYVPDNLIALSNNAFRNMPNLETKEIVFPNVKYFTADNYGNNLGAKFMGIFYQSKAGILKFPKITSINKGLSNSSYPLFGKSTIDYVVFGSEEFPFTSWYEGFYSANSQAFGNSTIKTIYLVTKNGESTDVTFSGENFSKKSLIKYVKTTPKFLRDDLFEYVVENNEVTITSYHGTVNEVIIPSTIEGYPITRILKNVFANNTTIVKLVAPSVTSVGYNCFYKCTSLTSIDLPSVTSLDTYCFDACTSLTSINLPSVTSLGNYCFRGCTNLTSIELPSATSLSYNCFRGCSNLTSINSPLVTSLDDYCFYECSKLTSADLPLATSLGEYCFYKCTSLTSINSPLVTSLGYDCFYECSKLTSIDVPLATNLGGKCFYKCISLTSADLPLATSLGENCFYGCYNLTSIDLPSVNSLGEDCFRACSKLISITFGYIGKPISDTSNFSTKALTTYVTTLSIYVTSPSSPPTLTGSPWGATNAIITYEQA